MNDSFEKKVRAAAVAGWWTILIAVAFITLQWIIYLAVMATHPAWLLAMWGPGTDWPFVQQVWFWAIAILVADGADRALADALGEAVEEAGSDRIVGKGGPHRNGRRAPSTPRTSTRSRRPTPESSCWSWPPSSPVGTSSSGLGGGSMLLFFNPKATLVGDAPHRTARPVRAMLPWAVLAELLEP